MYLLDCSLNSVTVKGTTFEHLVDLAANAGFGGVSLWRDVLDDIDLSYAHRRLQDTGLAVSSVCRGGMFPQPNAQARRERLDDNRDAVDQAHALKADCLYLVCGPPTHNDLTGAREQVHDGIAELEPYARSAGVRLAVEPFHPMMASSRSVITSLTEANDLLDALNSDMIGIGIDSYHVWWEADLINQIARTGEKLFSVQLADWITPIHGELSSRGMPGEGCIDMTGFVEACRRTGYAGLIEVEVLSDRWWATPIEETMRAVIDGLTHI